MFCHAVSLRQQNGLCIWGTLMNLKYNDVCAWVHWLQADFPKHRRALPGLIKKVP